MLYRGLPPPTSCAWRTGEVAGCQEKSVVRGECGAAGELLKCGQRGRTVQLEFGCCPAERGVEGRSSQIPALKTVPLYEARAAEVRASRHALLRDSRDSHVSPMQVRRRVVEGERSSSSRPAKISTGSSHGNEKTLIHANTVLYTCYDTISSYTSSHGPHARKHLISYPQLTRQMRVLHIRYCRSFRQSQTSHPPIPCARALRHLCAGSSKLTQVDRLSGTRVKGVGQD